MKSIKYLLILIITGVMWGCSQEEEVSPVLMLQTAAGQQVQGTVTSNYKIPLSSFTIQTAAGGEQVDFSGEINLISRFIPGDPCHFHTNAVAIKGIGETSGSKYSLTGSTKFISEGPVSLPGEVEFGVTYTIVTGFNPILIPVDPCHLIIKAQLNGLGQVVNASVSLP